MGDKPAAEVEIATSAQQDQASDPYLPEKTHISSKNLDETYNTYKQQDGQDLDPVEARQVLRKIDTHILPLLMGTYLLQYLDKTSINSASVFGLQKGTNLQGQQYSWLTSLFYIGYLVAQPVAGYAIQRLPLGKVIGYTVLAWGLLTITTPACTNFAGIAANRFLLGVFESVVNPGFVLCLSLWYRADEQPMRMVSYYSMNGVAGIFGGLLGYAVGHITTGLPPWQYVFLIFGSVSLAWGVVFLVFMPDLPTTARFLNPHQKVVAVERVAQNRQGVKNHHFKKYQMWQCFRDPKTWILFVMSVAAQIPNAAQSTLGKTIDLSCNPVQVVSLLASGYIGSRFANMRCVVMLAGNLVCVAAGAALVGLPVGADGTENRWGRLVALWLCSFQSVGFSMSLTMVSSNVAGYTKKQLTGAILFVGYCIIGPQTFIETEAPLYTSACILIGYSVKTLMVIVLYIYMSTVNKKRDREAAVSGSNLTPEKEQEAIEQGMQDVTELDNPGFRYVL
ncbi:MFS general substrate transporter [Astrocystis sublimbata]|nr:MFS general substrate transporter [Astrocystis sublimbata]